MALRSASLAILAFGLLAVAPRAARAERKIFGFTYPYMTLPSGAREIEYALDIGLVPEANVLPDVAVAEGESPLTDLRPAFRHQVEFEYGITDRTDFGFYNVLSQDVGQPLNYEGVKLRSRHRFAEQGDLPLDIGVYGELGYFGDEYEIEERLLLAKSVRRIEIDFNLSLEQEIEREPEVDVAAGVASNETHFALGIVPSLGFAYHVRQSVAVGVEIAPEITLGDESDFVAAFGPTVSFSGNGFWWTLLAQYRVHSDEEAEAGEAQTWADSDVLIRSIFALTL